MQIYIDGIPGSVTDSELAPLFANVRSFQHVKVIRDIVSSESKGFALARINDDAEGQAAISRLNGTTFGGHKITVFKIHDTLPGEMEFREWMRDNADDILRKIGIVAGQTVIDYGCGPGIFSLAAAEIVGSKGKVYALDVRQRALDRLKEMASNQSLSNLQTMLIERTTVSVGLPDRTADTILLFDVLQEIPDKPGLMHELHRLLKDHGVLSVFPMHMGTDKFLEINADVGLFKVRDRHGYPGFASESEIINLVKR